MSNRELPQKLHKSIIRKFALWKLQSYFIDNIWGADLACMQLLSKFNKGIPFLWCVIDIFSEYAWVFLWKDKKGITVTNSFQEMLDEASRKLNKIWIDKSSDF